MSVHLIQIQDFIQSYVNAIAVILNVGVTVVDKDLVRIGGTSPYSDQIGQTINHASFYKKIISTGNPGIMCKSLDDQLCSQCNFYDECPELADIAYPIRYEDEVVGVIGIIAFSEQAKHKLIENDSNYKNFLMHMSMLLESKLLTLRQNHELEEKLDGVMSIARQEINNSHFVGQDSKIINMLNLAGRVCNSDSTILVTGESGTGKDVLAKVIHGMSTRADKMMISINCGAIPESLIESELFGYVAGAFTGANKKGQIGKFELANNSTLFLDEIGEMSLSAQTKLLRVLQEKVVFRIGSDIGIPVNVRVICATNQNLLTLVAENKFRMDLYYRINVLPFEIPPLRERLQDITVLSQVFLNDFNDKLRKNITLAKQEVIDIFTGYSWPGNVRELKNIIEYLVNIKDGGDIELEDLPSHFISSRLLQESENASLKSLLLAQEKQILKNLLVSAPTLPDKKDLAERLGISLSSLYRKMGQYDLQ
ncbi:(S)-limonene 6-monooxygenase [Pragia fontium]|uniref:Sigma-54 factor interaction domain-containing protein n=1 Tax=Pragia fontium TaxID=82985 RepID=A0ABQ5LFF4_9GAMM|nr:sigma 54-interacting transcriptional regulator [Pragia fontium]GKX62334.1 hypothetical protein SOASR032_09030 [Pragia fontium]SUB83167.1 (S)-limonene 6-monooxygenase [Pragia fontium]